MPSSSDLGATKTASTKTESNSITTGNTIFQDLVKSSDNNGQDETVLSGNYGSTIKPATNQSDTDHFKHQSLNITQAEIDVGDVLPPLYNEEPETNINHGFLWEQNMSDDEFVALSRICIWVKDK